MAEIQSAARHRLLPNDLVSNAFRQLVRVVHLGLLCLVEARPQVQSIFLLRFIAGGVVAAPALSDQRDAVARSVLTGSTAWWLAVVSVYLANGVMDITEDRANGSARPIARGDLSPKIAACVAIAAAVSALATAEVTGGRVVWWVCAFIALGWAYSVPPIAAKRRSWSCSAAVFGMGWTTYAAGAAAAANELGVTGTAFAAMASAWMALVGAVVKDLSDIKGDEAGGRRTFAVRHGVGATKRLVVVFATATGVCAPISAVIWAPLALAGAAPLAVGAAWVTALCQRPSRPVTSSGHIAGRGLNGDRAAYRVFAATQYAINFGIIVAALLRACVG